MADVSDTPGRRDNVVDRTPASRDSGRLDRLCDQTKTWYLTLSDFVFKHTTIQIVLLGWVLASEAAQQRVAEFESGPRFVAAALPIGYSLMVFEIYRRFARRSKRTLERIADLDPVMRNDLMPYEIRTEFWLGMAAVHLGLSVIIALLLLG